MRRIFSIFIAVFTFVAGLVALPASASVGLQPAVIDSNSSEIYAVPVVSKSGIGNRVVGEITVGEIAVIAAGAAVVGTAASILFDSGWLTILVVAVGAAGGSYWYSGEWPKFRVAVGSSIEIGR